jgi:hypothetical protein
MLTDGDIKSSLKPTASTNGRAVLTKTELIEEVLRVAEIPRKEAAVIVARILDSMVRAIDRGDKGNMDSTVSLPNTGFCAPPGRLWRVPTAMAELCARQATTIRGCGDAGVGRQERPG